MFYATTNKTVRVQNCNVTLLHHYATANFATAQGGKHEQQIIELFATKGILIKTNLFKKNVYLKTYFRNNNIKKF